ncbi:MEKHLA domain-containing protein [Jeongeupia wiesaeckerbachi]|uniref:MEKHLA domain-containing protein n=1 Tax=Jeongeupia wiesaeckerbachi TaxID=3051218 RepID=UPI003D8060A2
MSSTPRCRPGDASGYRGLRIAQSGRCFWIENLTVWRLLDKPAQPRSGASRPPASAGRRTGSRSIRHAARRQRQSALRR